jgi:transcriptional regulator with XRE-family HTH domain
MTNAWVDASTTPKTYQTYYIFIMNEISDKIVNAMASARMTQEQLAEKVGVSQKTVSDWIKGARPRATALIRISKALGVDLAPSPAPTHRSDISPALAQMKAERDAAILRAETAEAALRELMACRPSAAIPVDKAGGVLKSLASRSAQAPTAPTPTPPAQGKGKKRG